jgi:hypothetical protein
MRLQSHPLGYEIKGEKKSYIVTHGGLANRESMLPIAYALSDNGHNVIIADLPRHGASSDTKKKGKALWNKAIRKAKITHGIGHSLGGAWICPTNNYIRQITNVTPIGHNCSNNGLYGKSFRVHIPFIKGDYHIDHLIETWNPNVLFRIKDISKNNWNVYVYSFIPWSIFCFGFLFAIALFRSWYSSNDVLERYKKPPIFVGYWMVVFSILMYKKLWYPFPNGFLDWLILFGGSSIPIFLENVCKKVVDGNSFGYRCFMSLFHFVYFMSIVCFFTYLGTSLQVWPKPNILFLLIGLNFVTFFLVYAFVALLSLRSYSERIWLYGFLSMYLFVLLTPWYSIV